MNLLDGDAEKKVSDGDFGENHCYAVPDVAEVPVLYDALVSRFTDPVIAVNTYHQCFLDIVLLEIPVMAAGAIVYARETYSAKGYKGHLKKKKKRSE